MLPIVMRLVIPAGLAGPEPVEGDVRAFLVPHGDRIVLVDTSMEAAGSDLDAGLAELGAGWADVSDVVISHYHPDHTGGLEHVRAAAPAAAIWSGDELPGVRRLGDGDRVGPLRVFATPGHTPGHISLVDEDSGDVFIGDCVGSDGRRLVRGPAVFTADAAQAEQSLRRLGQLGGARMLFAHGPEIDDPWAALAALVD